MNNQLKSNLSNKKINLDNHTNEKYSLMQEAIQTHEEQYLITYIIGDKFYEFSKSSHVISISEFFKKMERDDFSNNNQIYYFGQGLSDHEKNTVSAYCEKNNITIFNGNKSAESALTHKLKQENIMITEPQIIENNNYQSYLVINDDCAEMSDHVTGRHIQGMVLIEAARQMMLAVSEKYILGTDGQGKAYCILNNIVTTFKQFVFPIEVVINHIITNVQSLRNGVHSVRCVTQFIQGNQIATEIEIEYKLYEKNKMAKREEQIAEKCLELSAQKIKESYLAKLNIA